MKAFDELLPRHREFIEAQKMFFVGSAPLSPRGHVNVSPKGLDSLTLLDATRVAYIDLGGSGIETHAHMRENGRLCMMFCAFEGKPLILRVYGQGRAHSYGSASFDALREAFPNVDVPVRGIIELSISRVQDSCGWGVPLYAYQGDRDRLLEHNRSRSQEEHMERRLQTNGRSIDGLPGLSRS
jgi:hypothetical protein